MSRQVWKAGLPFVHLLAAYHVVQAIGSKPPQLHTSVPNVRGGKQTSLSLLSLVTVTMHFDLFTGRAAGPCYHSCYFVALLTAVRQCTDTCATSCLSNVAAYRRQAAALSNLNAQCACGSLWPMALALTHYSFVGCIQTVPDSALGPAI